MKNASNSNTRKKRIRRTAEEWRALISGFTDSGMTLERYCQSHGVSLSGFYTWRKRFESEYSSPSTKPSFIELVPPESAYRPQDASDAVRWRLELELGDDMRLRIR